jgi:hypothetical protein
MVNLLLESGLFARKAVNVDRRCASEVIAAVSIQMDALPMVFATSEEIAFAKKGGLDLSVTETQI